MIKPMDAVIIGGGPAGASAALLLARAGWSVAVIEKKLFPRSKVCGEFVSATTLPLMQELGILDFYLQEAGPPVQRVGWFIGKKMLTAPMPSFQNPISSWGRALGRDQLDSFLLKEAQQAGAQIWQPWNARQLVDMEDHFLCTLVNHHQTKEIAARIVIIAHGSWKQGVVEVPFPPNKDSDLLAFKAHFFNSSLDKDLMSLFSFRGGYGGLVHTNNNRTSLSCCIRRDVLRQIRLQNPGVGAGETVLKFISESCAGVDQVLSSSIREQAWLAAGPLRPGIRRGYHQGMFYIGNMAGEAHPIIAEGISMAMQSAWLLVQSLFALKTLERKDFLAIGQDYSKHWRAQFANRIRAAALFAGVTTRPHLASLILPLAERFPGFLTHAAKWSGKTSRLQFAIEKENTI
jgi:flavin-dependent dehydrogenase